MSKLRESLQKFRNDYQPIIDRYTIAPDAYDHKVMVTIKEVMSEIDGILAEAKPRKAKGKWRKLDRSETIQNGDRLNIKKYGRVIAHVDEFGCNVGKWMDGIGNEGSYVERRVPRKAKLSELLKRMPRGQCVTIYGDGNSIVQFIGSMKSDLRFDDLPALKTYLATLSEPEVEK